MMEKEELKYLVEWFQGVSPELWNVALTYIHAAALQWLVASIAAVALGLFLIILEYKKGDEWSSKMSGAGYFFGVLAIVFSVCFYIAYTGRINAPEIYAIRYLLEMRP